MKKYLLSLVCLVLVTAWTTSVSAHVLLRDARADIGAVLHINPDDDPIAGQTSQLYFDLQDKNSQVRIAYSGYELIIADERNGAVTVPLTVSGSTLQVEYTFPSQGLYRLTLRSKASYDQFQKVAMRDSLRVSRGVAGRIDSKPKHPLASVISLAVTVAFISLVILAWNYRHIIARHSRF